MNLRLQSLLVIFLVIIFASLSLGSALQESLTYDEIVHIEDGVKILSLRTFTVDPYNPPLIKELTALPFVLGLDKLVKSELPSDKYLAGRLVVTLMGVGLLLAVYNTTKQYFDKVTALFALFLLTFEPNILAHSHYITLDVGTTLFIFLSYVAFLAVLNKGTRENFIKYGFLAGLALASRVSALTFLIASKIVIFSVVNKGRRIYRIKHQAWKIILAVTIASLTLWATFFFRNEVVIAARDDSSRISNRLLVYAKSNNLDLIVWVINKLQTQKVPLGNYFATLKNNLIRSTSPTKVFFFGQHYEQVSWYMMATNLILKTPLPLIILLAITIFSVIKKRFKTLVYRYFGVPFVVILLIATISRMSPQVRYILPIYPFLVILAASGFKLLLNKKRKLILFGLCFWYVISSLSYFPHFISYANELAGPRNTRFKLFVDSNIDWGQSLPDLATYLSVVKPSKIIFSYFGRDNGDLYGLKSDFAYGSYKFEDICAFHEIKLPASGTVPTLRRDSPSLAAISISNWYYCGYYKDAQFSEDHIVDVVADSILIF